MNIEELYVKSFGKLKNMKIVLTKGFNVVYGQNESGKSTLIAFIRAMIYGLSEKKNKTPDRISYMPWDGSEAEGSMVIDYEGKKLIIYRKFDRNNHRKDQCQISDAIKGTQLNLNGEDITGLTLSAFDNTLFIRQLSVTKVSDENKELYNRLVNIAQTGQEDTDAGNALVYLENRIRELSSRRKDVSINSWIEQKNLLEKELDGLVKQHQMMMEDQSKVLSLKESLEELDKEIATIDKIRPSFVMLDEWEKDFLKLKNEIEEFDREIKVLETSTLNRYLEELQNKQKRLDELLSQRDYHVDEKVLKRYSRYPLYITVGTLLAIAGLIAGFANLMFLFFLIIGSGMVFMGYIWKKQYSRLMRKKQQEEDREFLKKQLISEIDDVKTLINQSEVKLGQLNFAKHERQQRLQELKKRIDSLLNSLSAYDGIIGYHWNGIDKNYDLDNIMQLLSQKMRQKEAIIKEIASIEERWKDEDLFARIPALRQEIELLDKRIERMNFEYKAVKLAYDVMKDCLEEINTDFAPRLIENAGKIIKAITRKYERVGIDSENLRLHVIVPEYGIFKSPFDLSGGTADQIYLGFRIALADAVALDKKPPLILDDALVQYDDERLKNALSFLLEYSKTRQIILFTCHEREINVIKNLYDREINIIRL